MCLRRSLAISLLGLASAYSFPRALNVTSLFTSGLSAGASIYYPTDPNYDEEVTQRYSTFDEPGFIVAIKPDTFEDVQNIVRIANQNGLPFLATGGAHGAGVGFSNVENAVDIDLGNFNTTKLDVETGILTIGPGVVFSDIYDPLYNAGKEIQTGNAPCVNMIGATLGAGVGPLQGIHGLIIDALHSVTLVTANGSLVKASSTKNPDLFWAIRGAGANFGIIVSADYVVHPQTNGGQLINADFQIDPAYNVSLWEILRSWDSEDVYPPEMSLTISAGVNATDRQKGSLSVNIGYFGTQEEAQPFIDQIVALNPILWQNLSVPWNQWTTVAGFGHAATAACTRGYYTNHLTVGLKQTDVETFTSIFNSLPEFAASRPWYTPSLAFQRYNSKASEAVPDCDRGVYPWRDTRTIVALSNYYSNSTQNDEVLSFMGSIRSQLQAVSGFNTSHTYINYGLGDEGPSAWWSEANLPKLINVKREWDPDRRFGVVNPIPLT